MAKNIDISAWEQIDLHDPAAVLKHGVSLFQPNIALACSFGLEDVVLVDMLSKVEGQVRIISLDTGRLPEETYQCAEAIRERYGVAIHWVFPEREAIEKLERAKGLFSFRESVENRRECCHLRKVEPLGRALAGMDAWITGLRQEQSVTRVDLSVLEDDVLQPGRLKINPLVNWTLDQVWAYIHEEDVPYNTLSDKGYPSIGCAPCTRAIGHGEDQRAGRWWWEAPEKKECGLHNGKRENPQR